MGCSSEGVLKATGGGGEFEGWLRGREQLGRREEEDGERGFGAVEPQKKGGQN